MKYASECRRLTAQVSSYKLSAYFVMQSERRNFDADLNEMHTLQMILNHQSNLLIYAQPTGQQITEPLLSRFSNGAFS